MTTQEFKEKLQAIQQTLFSDTPTDNHSIEKNYFEVLSPFLAAFNGPVYTFFALNEETETTIEFVINNRVSDLFLVKKDDMYNHDPMVYIKIKEEWESYTFSLSTLLLTEYVDWLAENTNSKLEFRIEGYGMYIPIKKHWDQFFNPFSYPNKIWIGKELKSVILIQNEISTLKCMAMDAETLQLAQKLLEEG